mmetsp:Transcript_1397/g.3665  ORF Transcript_1397/g.3665 Transcript_1397/m.3665 type:complete len:422 (-) Transcript_1397:537-1802(-)
MCDSRTASITTMPPSCVAGTMRPSVASITMPSWHHAAKLAHRVCCITKWTSLRRSGLIAEQATNSTGESSWSNVNGESESPAAMPRCCFVRSDVSCIVVRASRTRDTSASSSLRAAAGAAAALRFECHTAQLNAETAGLAAGCKAVCLFVNDDASADVLRALSAHGVELILMRCAGFDKVDLAVAAELGIKVARVPAYSPEAVAQQAVALLFTLKWKLFEPAATGALGIDLSGTTVGVLGTGRIGYLFAMIMQGLGCNVIAYDPFKNKAIEAAGIPYMELDEIYAQADVLSVHVPLLPQTKGLINAEAIGKFKPGATLLNVSRGALVDSQAIVDALASGQIGAYGTDVYEHEAAYFFDDHSSEPMADGLLAAMIGSPNFQLTGHQAFLTREALEQIVGTTMKNLGEFLEGAELTNAVKPPA